MAPPPRSTPPSRNPLQLDRSHHRPRRRRPRQNRRLALNAADNNASDAEHRACVRASRRRPSTSPTSVNMGKNRAKTRLRGGLSCSRTSGLPDQARVVAAAVVEAGKPRAQRLRSGTTSGTRWSLQSSVSSCRLCPAGRLATLRRERAVGTDVQEALDRLLPQPPRGAATGNGGRPDSAEASASSIHLLARTRRPARRVSKHRQGPLASSQPLPPAARLARFGWPSCRPRSALRFSSCSAVPIRPRWVAWRRHATGAAQLSRRGCARTSAAWPLASGSTSAAVWVAQLPGAARHSGAPGRFAA